MEKGPGEVIRRPPLADSYYAVPVLNGMTVAPLG
jgi:hypothetical protein